MRNDLSGRRYGRLVVVSFHGSTGGRRYWDVRCDCGTEKRVRGTHMVSGATSSCGCWHDEAAVINNIQHGQARRRTVGRTVEYRTWCNIINRCEAPRSRCYVNYGGRGIRVCARWRESYQSFFDDMGARPSPHHSIERNDVNGNYDPENCRWATRREQARNTRSSRYLTVGGQRLTIAEWGDRTGIRRETIWARLASGWSDSEAVNTPLGSRPSRVAA